MARLRELLAHLHCQPEARIFAVNVLLQMRAGLLTPGEVRQFLRALRDRYSALVDTPSYRMAMHDPAALALLLWQMCEAVAVSDRFACRPAQRCAPAELPDDADVVTVSTSNDIAQHYFDPGAYLQRVLPLSPRLKNDHEAFKAYLKSQTPTGKAPTYLDAETLRHALKPTIYRGSAPFFWISPKAAERESMSAGELRDRLGLIHLRQRGVWLIEISLAGSAVKQHFKGERHWVMRPRAIGSRPGPRFLGLSRAEANRCLDRAATLDATGATVDLARFASGADEITGWPELICREVPWSGNDAVERERWWKVFRPRLRVVGELVDPPRGELPGVDDHGAYEARVRRDFARVIGSWPSAWLPPNG